MKHQPVGDNCWQTDKECSASIFREIEARSLSLEKATITVKSVNISCMTWRSNAEKDQGEIVVAGPDEQTPCA